MPSSGATMPHRAWHLDAVLIATGMCCLWLSLGQNLIHGFDALNYLEAVAAGNASNELHALYLPLAIGWTRLLDNLGVPQYEAMRSLSAIGAALGVYGCHRAAVRLGWDRERALMAAIGIGAIPAVFYSATIVEIDAVAFGCFGLAWIPFAQLLREGRRRLAIPTGVATGVAAAVHASGNVFAAVLCCLGLLSLEPRSWRLRFANVALLAATHAAVSLAVNLTLGARSQGVMVTNALALRFRGDVALQVLVAEVLLPYLPFVLLAIAGWWRRETRGMAAGFCLCLSGYFVLTTLVMGAFREEARFGPQGRSVERGAFFLGLTVPMVLLAVGSLPGRWAWCAIAVGAVSAITQQRLHDWPADPPGFADGWAEVASKSPVCVIFADSQELAWVVRRRPFVVGEVVGALRRRLEIATQMGVAVPSDYVVTWFAGQVQAQEQVGGKLLLTDRARTTLLECEDRTIAAAAARLPEFFTFTPVAAGSFVAWWLRSR